jgi:pilus assembly protein Flp/PilA
MKILRKLLKNDKGATAIEYGLIAALIAVAAITAMQGLGTQLNTTLTSFGFVELPGGGTCVPPPVLFAQLRLP